MSFDPAYNVLKEQLIRLSSIETGFAGCKFFKNCLCQVELKLAAERLHVQDLTSSMGHTEAFRLMMKEKESLITERYKLNDTVNQLRKQVKSAEDKWKVERAALEKVAEEKTKALEEARTAREKLQNELSQVRVSDRLIYYHEGANSRRHS
jgi:vacuolar-type H+-ATPase subunit I/STV1